MYDAEDHMFGIADDFYTAGPAGREVPRGAASNTTASPLSGWGSDHNPGTTRGCHCLKQAAQRVR